MATPLSSLQVADLSGLRMFGASRELAMAIPTAAACRNLICGTISQMGISRQRGTDTLTRGTLLTQPDPSSTWADSVTHTVDDLLFHGKAAWLVLARDGIATEANPQGLPVRARRLPIEQVERIESEVISDYQLVKGYRIGSQRIRAEDVIWFDMGGEGILTYGSRALVQAYELEGAAARMASMELPAGILKTENDVMDAQSAKELVTAFTEARKTNAIAFLQGIDFETSQWNSHDLQLVEARALAATEIARLFGVPVSMVSASPSGNAASMLYANVSSQWAAFVKQAVAPVIVALEQTFSLPTVTPRGQSVNFEVAAFLRSDPEAAVQFATQLVGAEIITPDEARSFLGVAPEGQTVRDNTPGVV